MKAFSGRGAAGRALLLAAAILSVAAFFSWRAAPPIESARPASAGSSPPVDFAFTRLARPRALPALEFTDRDGRELSLADFRGRAVLLNLWATWCAPCRTEMPTLDRLQKKLGGPHFQVVALSIDRRGLAAVERFYKQFKLTSLGVYLDPSGEAAAKLRAIGLPTSFLIDRRGREIARKIGPAEWDAPKTIARIKRWLAPPG